MQIRISYFVSRQVSPSCPSSFRHPLRILPLYGNRTDIARHPGPVPEGTHHGRCILLATEAPSRTECFTHPMRTNKDELSEPRGE